MIGGLFVRERVFDLLLEHAVVGERVPLRRQAAPVEHDELPGDVAHRFANSGARLLPFASAHLRKLRLVATGVLADETDVFGIDVDAVASLELDDQAVARDAEHLARLHALVLADAVRAVHDVVADRQPFVMILPLAPAARTPRR